MPLSIPLKEFCVGSGLLCSKLAHCRKPYPQKVDIRHINVWARIAHSLVLNTLPETTDPCIILPRTCSHTFSLTHSLCCLPPPRHTHSTQPQTSIAQTEGTLSQLKVTKRQVICQAVPELNLGTGFLGQRVFEPEAMFAWALAPRASSPHLSCLAHHCRVADERWLLTLGSLIAMVSPT